jgi:hypothetical protein
MDLTFLNMLDPASRKCDVNEAHRAERSRSLHERVYALVIVVPQNAPNILLRIACAYLVGRPENTSLEWGWETTTGEGNTKAHDEKMDIASHCLKLLSLRRSPIAQPTYEVNGCGL